MAAIVLNANIEPLLEKMDSASSELVVTLPSLLTRQGGEPVSHIWLNGEFKMQLQTPFEPETPKSPLDEKAGEISGPELVSSCSQPEEVTPHGYSDLGLD